MDRNQPSLQTKASAQTYIWCMFMLLLLLLLLLLSGRICRSMQQVQ
jgi:hypothetical protein